MPGCAPWPSWGDACLAVGTAATAMSNSATQQIVLISSSVSSSRVASTQQAGCHPPAQQRHGLLQDVSSLRTGCRPGEQDSAPVCSRRTGTPNPQTAARPSNRERQASHFHLMFSSRLASVASTLISFLIRFGFNNSSRLTATPLHQRESARTTLFASSLAHAPWSRLGAGAV